MCVCVCVREREREREEGGGEKGAETFIITHKLTPVSMLRLMVERSMGRWMTSL